MVQLQTTQPAPTPPPCEHMGMLKGGLASCHEHQALAAGIPLACFNRMQVETRRLASFLGLRARSRFV